jgi:hypothetical protein
MTPVTRSSFSIALVAFLVAASAALAGDWSGVETVRYRDDAVASFRARVVGGYLVVEAELAPGWHAFALDNVERARRRSGKEDPETELPTRIEVQGGLELIGPWYQSPPVDLSQPELRWYTWGFEGTATLCSKVSRPVGSAVGESAFVVINGQACTEEVCARIDDLVLEVTVDEDSFAGEPTVELAALVAVLSGG